MSGLGRWHYILESNSLCGCCSLMNSISCWVLFSVELNLQLHSINIIICKQSIYFMFPYFKNGSEKSSQPVYGTFWLIITYTIAIFFKDWYLHNIKHESTLKGDRSIMLVWYSFISVYDNETECSGYYMCKIIATGVLPDHCVVTIKHYLGNEHN